MKKLISLALVLVMAFALCSVGAYADNPVVKIGVFEPQSGRKCSACSMPTP